jgi:hypothetical protein
MAPRPVRCCKLCQSIKLRTKFPTEDRVCYTMLAARIQCKSQGRWQMSTGLVDVENQTTRSQSTGNFRWTFLGLNSELRREKQEHTSPIFGTFHCAQHKYRCYMLIALTRFFLEYKLQDYSKNCCGSCLSFCLYINRSASIPHGKHKDRVHNSVTTYCLSNGLGGSRPHPLFGTHFEIIFMPTRNFILLMPYLKFGVVCS